MKILIWLLSLVLVIPHNLTDENILLYQRHNLAIVFGKPGSKQIEWAIADADMEIIWYSSDKSTYFVEWPFDMPTRQEVIYSVLAMRRYKNVWLVIPANNTKEAPDPKSLSMN